jgi:hypothetical protein
MAMDQVFEKEFDTFYFMTIIIVTTAKKKPFNLVYADIVRQHLRAIGPKYYSLIRKAIEEQLLFEPDVETKNRKPLKRTAPFAEEAEWEIRFGPDNRFRVFYDVDRRRRDVYILAIGVKRGNRLVIGKEEVQL